MDVLSARARVFEYTAAADPSTFMAPIPFVVFPAELHETANGASEVIELDLSKKLSIRGPATSPNLRAAFLRVVPEQQLTTDAVATSSMFYVIRGGGSTKFSLDGVGDTCIAWQQGDLFTVPGHTACSHAATSDSALYHVNDAPLLDYLGVSPSGSRFQPAFFSAAMLARELARVNSEMGAATRNRNGVLLGSSDTESTTKTLTHTLWALWNALPAGVVQPPHRHQSVALDLCVSAGPDTYTEMSAGLDADGALAEPVIRAYWKPGAVFVTPPGMWHSHHNHSSVDAIVLPVQDAGLYTHQRTLDIQFAPRRKSTAST